MNILQVLQRFRDDLKTWVTNNLEALNKKIDEKTLPVDTKLSSTSKNPVQNKVINAELSNLKDLVGNTSVANQINTAIAKQPHFSGDYNDLVNAPNIAEDDSGELTITDEEGNVIIKVDAEGLHTPALTLDGKPAASKDYVDNAIATNVDFTGYATEKLVEQAIEDVKNELSESIVSQEDEWKIVDNSGNIIFKVDADGLHTTDLSLGDKKAATEEYVNEAVAEIPTPDVSGQINIHNTSETAHEDIRQAIETTKEELSESIVSNSDEWKVVDEAGNIIFGLDESGAHTTSLTVNGENVATETYVNDAIANIDLDGYATETYVDNKVADLVNSAPEALNTLGELAAALENHEDAYDALLETVGGKATHADLENLKEELSESIIAEAEDWKVVDGNGNIIFSVDLTGAHTTNLTLDGQSVEDMIDGKVDKVDGKGLSTNDFTNEYKEKLDGLENIAFEESDPTVPAWAKTENKPIYTADEVGALSKDTPLFSGDYNDLENAPDISEDDSGDLVIADKDGNIIFRSNGDGFETVNLTVQNITINGKTIQEMIQEYVNETILGGAW